MKKALALLLALAMMLSLAGCSGGGDETAAGGGETSGAGGAEETSGGDSEEVKDYSDYTIRIYSNSNSTERATWLINEARDAGFTISMDDNSVISGDTAAIQAANENKDCDLIFGLNETRWSQLVNGVYENLSLYITFGVRFDVVWQCLLALPFCCPVRDL